MGPHEMAVADIHGSEVRRTSPTEARQMLHLPSHQFVPRERVMAQPASWISKRTLAPNAISPHDFPLSKFSPSDSPSYRSPFYTRSPQHSQNSLRKCARYRSAADDGERNWEEESHHEDEEDEFEEIRVDMLNRDDAVNGEEAERGNEKSMDAELGEAGRGPERWNPKNARQTCTDCRN
jgi:hypothetical protein